jgi:hypothetical protein
MSELPTARSMRQLFSQIALLREYQEAEDPRCADAARNLHLLAATTAEVPAYVILRLNDACARVGPSDGCATDDGDGDRHRA